MKVKKIYLKNFKGIKKETILELTPKTTLLIGPNGFGKTTIFDAIELCLTGKMHRTNEKKGVTNDTNDYIKPFFQNDKNQEVTIKLWVENEIGEVLIIVRHLPSDPKMINYSVGKQNKPNDFSILGLYSDKVEEFDKPNFNAAKAESLEEESIAGFFEFKNDSFKLDKIYHLFNYLQQEETTYFLKKSEKDRKDELGFLFQTKRQEDKLKTITSHLKNFKNLYKNLQSKITQLKQNKSTTDTKYIKLFPNKAMVFDGVTPFQDQNLVQATATYTTYFDSLKILKAFSKNFSPIEYKKKQTSDEITRLLEDKSFIHYHVLGNYLDDAVYNDIKDKHSILLQESLLETYILKDHFSKQKSYIQINDTFQKITKYNATDEIVAKLEVLKPLVKIWLPSKLTSFEALVIERATNYELADSIDKTLVDIKAIRNDLQSKHTALDENESDCPYCGSPLGSPSNLLKEFELREISLMKLSNSQTGKLQEITASIDSDFEKPIAAFIKEFLEKNSEFDKELLEKIKEHNDRSEKLQPQIVKIDAIMPKDKPLWAEVKKFVDLNKAVLVLKQIIKDSVCVTADIYEKLKKSKQETYPEQIKLIAKLKVQQSVDAFKINTQTEQVIDNTTVELSKAAYCKYIEELKVKFMFDVNKSKDESNLYKTYFDENGDIFTATTLEAIENKVLYISQQLNLVKNTTYDQYVVMRDKVKNIMDKTEKLKGIYDTEINRYQKDMANKIKLPFFIYTAKILQNYQQGMGIFLTAKDNSSIRFLTHADSDHDAIHHLSSGQLAVVSLAFCLAINKTYKISNNLKFLAIDDPIQEMDSLNIHSFIELVRHELVDDYQLIFSTHNDASALFMKYKIEKMHNNAVNMIDVQSEFFS